MNVFSQDFLFRNALAGGLLVMLLCAVLGLYVALRRLSLLGVALPQAGAAGIACVFWATAHAHPAGASTHALALGGSLAFTFGALGLLALGGRRGELPEDSRIAALFALSSALTVLFVALNPGGDFEVTSLLRGELLAISDADLVLVSAVATTTALLFFLFRREILLVSFDPDFARTLGRDPLLWNGLLYVLLGLAISVGVMTVGPLVVFGFLTLPALAALQLASSLAMAFAIAAAVAAIASLGGFALAYHADLPAGPVDVALAAALWLLASAWSRFARARRGPARALRALALLAGLPLAAFGPLGCGALFGMEPAGAGPAPRGSLPQLEPSRPVAVLRIRNDTGEPLRIASHNPLDDLGRAAGDPFASPGITVPDVLQQAAIRELTRRGVPVLSAEAVHAAIPGAPADRIFASAAAVRAGLAGPVLLGTLRRWTWTHDQRVLVQLDLELVDPQDGRVLWTGSARRPVPVPAAQTQTEAVRDASGPLFAEAFGSR